MRRHRLHLPRDLESGQELELEGERSHYLGRVLRLQAGDLVYVFDGSGREFSARITTVQRGQVLIRLEVPVPNHCESPLKIHLVQSISRGERMDLTLQKATELGVASIQPLVTRRTEVKLQGKRLDKRMDHWRGVISAACEQCGRAAVPEVFEPCKVPELLARTIDGPALLLSPAGDRRLAEMELPGKTLALAAGPEGGFSDAEESAFRDAGWRAVTLGPRILRTETAGPAAVALAQGLWGDL
ncbi:MAG: 16S rRNA (uracil(1498)-N(3))-methyltransferase [Xanthomonadales bacterium]|nr:16S rRNA (uracil(1498)-N(3))-methyltransferase [Xanthomonadales bacterium]